MAELAAEDGDSVKGKRMKYVHRTACQRDHLKGNTLRDRRPAVMRITDGIVIGILSLESVG